MPQIEAPKTRTTDRAPGRVHTWLLGLFWLLAIEGAFSGEGLVGWQWA